MNPSAAAHQAVSPNEIYIDQTLYTGRPDNFTLRLPKEQRVYTLLDSLGLSYTRLITTRRRQSKAAMSGTASGHPHLQEPVSLQCPENQLLPSDDAR